jgi:hypothetical protein
MLKCCLVQEWDSSQTDGFPEPLSSSPWQDSPALLLYPSSSLRSSHTGGLEHSFLSLNTQITFCPRAFARGRFVPDVHSFRFVSNITSSPDNKLKQRLLSVLWKAPDCQPEPFSPSSSPTCPITPTLLRCRFS